MTNNIKKLNSLIELSETDEMLKKEMLRLISREIINWDNITDIVEQNIKYRHDFSKYGMLSLNIIDDIKALLEGDE